MACDRQVLAFVVRFRSWSVISAILTAEQRADVPSPVQETVRFGTARQRGL